MNTRVLGRTGLKVSELALGGLFVSSLGGEASETTKAVRRAAELGINYIDTAPGYLDSEAVLGGVLTEIDVPLIVSTKLGGRPEPFNPKDKDALRWSFAESLRLLKRDHIDILFIHEPDRPRLWDWWDDREKCTGPVADLLDELKAEGLIRFTGLAGTTAYEMVPLMRSGKFDVVLTAFNYSLLWREAELDIIPTATEMNMGIVLGSPLQQGALAKRWDEEVNHGAPWMSKPRREQFKKLYQLLDETGMPLPEMALRFCLSNAAISCVLTGAKSVAELEQNFAAAQEGPLPDDLLGWLEEIYKMVPFRPYEEPFGLPFAWPYQGPGGAGR
jgi:aryl-alcohol dehydrogenase-like predicted oxidoreductase